MNLTQQQVRLALYAVRDLIARRTLAGQPIPRQFHLFHDQLAGSVLGTKEAEPQQESTPEELIDTNEAAAILHCSTRWIRTIRTDLDGANIAGRWVFKRQTVVDYAEAKGARDDRDRLPATRRRAVPA